MQSTFKIGELARLYGIGADTIRYYEEQGLIQPRRGENGYRLYSIHDIWRMNVIRDLRGLGFPVERIRVYLQEHSMESTLSLLEEELHTIEGRQAELAALRKNVQSRIANLREAGAQPTGQITRLGLPPLRCRRIAQDFTTDEEMDVLMKRLIGQSGRYIIGSNQVGAQVKLGGDGTPQGYSAAFILDEAGESRLEGGQFLVLRYQGGSENTALWLPKMAQHAKSLGRQPTTDARELIWIDIHESADTRQHITELQLRLA